MTTSYERTSAGLRHYANMTQAAIADHLGRTGLSTPLHDMVMDYPARGGKGIRPALLMATCQAYGRPAEEALPAAVSLEMMHNAFLIHDDVEDESRVRRGQPALHEMYGIGLAVNAGDTLAQLALEPIRNATGLGSRLTNRLISELRLVVRQATEGQAQELGWRRDNRVDLSDADYLDMAGRKTCWYTTVAPLRMGAIVGSTGTTSLDALSLFGYYLGLAFQIRDDLLDLDTGLSPGSQTWGDIAEGKRTLILIHLLARANDADRSWLLDYLNVPDSRTATDPARVLALMARYGSRTYAEQYGEHMESAARSAFEEAFAQLPDSEAKRFLKELIPFMLARPA